MMWIAFFKAVLIPIVAVFVLIGIFAMIMIIESYRDGREKHDSNNFMSGYFNRKDDNND